MYISVPLTIKNTAQWSLSGSVIAIRLFWKTLYWIVEETKLALNNSEIIQCFPLCIRYFKAVRLSNHSVPARSKLFAAISVMCDRDHHCSHHQHDQHVWETRLDCKSELSRNAQIFTWDCRPSCRHTARYLSWPEAAVQRDSTLKWAKSLGVEKGLQHFYSHRMWNQFKTLPKAQRTQR